MEEDLCVCPRPVPKDPQLGTLSVLSMLIQTLWAQEKGHWIVRTLPSPRLAPF